MQTTLTMSAGVGVQVAEAYYSTDAAAVAVVSAVVKQR